MKRIASVAVISADGRLLIGKRSDDHRWNLPGGHVDAGESPEQGAARELEEETGIKADPKHLTLLRPCQTVTTYTGKTIEVYSYVHRVAEPCHTKREGTDPGEAHDWSWINVSNGLPADISLMWHNKTDATMDALGLKVAQNPSMDKSDDLEKAWPKHYNRVEGQDKDKGVASEKQKRFMHAVAAGGASGHAPSAEEAKDYVKNTGDKDLPESGSGGMRGERERKAAENKHKKRKKKDHEVKKSSDLFYAKVEGLLEKGFPNEELLSHLMDAELVLRDSEDDDGLDGLYCAAERLFDAAMSKEEQTVYELSYLAREGDESAAETLFKFVEEMQEELLKNMTVEFAVSQMVKSNYGPKKIGEENVQLYNAVDNVGRKMRRTGVVHENVGRNVAEQKYTPAVQGTMAQQADRESKRDKQKSKKNPVKVYTDEEKAALQAKYDTAKKADTDELISEHKRLVHVLETPSHEDDKEEAKKQKKELKEYEKDRAEAVGKSDDMDKGAVKQEATTCSSCHKPVMKSKAIPLRNAHKDKATGNEKEFSTRKWMCESCFGGQDKKDTTAKSEDNSKVKGKANGASYRMVHGYKRYTSGPKRGEYVHRHEAEKRLGRKLGTKEHVDHKDGNRAGTKNTKVMSASKHAAKTNSTRANSKGYSGGKRYEHTRDLSKADNKSKLFTGQGFVGHADTKGNSTALNTHPDERHFEQVKHSEPKLSADQMKDVHVRYSHSIQAVPTVHVLDNASGQPTTNKEAAENWKGGGVMHHVFSVHHGDKHIGSVDYIGTGADDHKDLDDSNFSPKLEHYLGTEYDPKLHGRVHEGAQAQWKAHRTTVLGQMRNPGKGRKEYDA